MGSAVINQMAVNLLYNEGDVMKAMRGLVTADFLKNLGITLMVGPGAGLEVGFWQALLMNMVRNSLRAGLNAALLKQDLKEGITSGLLTALADTAAQFVCRVVGKAYHPPNGEAPKLNFLTHKLAHGLIHGIAGAIAHPDDPERAAFISAFAAMMAETVADIMSGPVTEVLGNAKEEGRKLTPEEAAVLKEKIRTNADIARMAVGLTAFFSGMDVNMAVHAADISLSENEEESMGQVIDSETEEERREEETPLDAEVEALLERDLVQEAMANLFESAQAANGMLEDLRSGVDVDETSFQARESWRRSMYLKLVNSHNVLVRLGNENPDAQKVLKDTVDLAGTAMRAWMYFEAFSLGTAACAYGGPLAPFCGMAAMGGVYMTEEAANAAAAYAYDAVSEDARAQGRTEAEGIKLQRGMENLMENAMAAGVLRAVGKGVKVNRRCAKKKKVAARENQGPYEPRRMEEHLKNQNPGAAVDSSTLPGQNQKNVRLGGKRHEGTGIVFDQRGFPIFDDIAKFDTRIAREFSSIEKSKLHMREATIQLRAEINAGRFDASNFTPIQLQAIQRGSRQIPGYTWHHHQDTGRMQLVPKDIHQKTGHIGGMHMWEFKKEGKK